VVVFGAIFSNSNELTGNLARFLPRGALSLGFDSQTAQFSPAALQHLPDAVRSGYIHAYAASLRPVFLIAGVIGVLGFALTWLLRGGRSSRHNSSPGHHPGLHRARLHRVSSAPTRPTPRLDARTRMSRGGRGTGSAHRHA
jgi:hypothetical protein